MTKRLDGKVIIITGGSGLIGTGFVRSCAAQGAHVIVLDLKEPPESVRKLPSVSFFECNLNDEQSVTDALLLITKHHKRIDGLINNAYPRNKNYGRSFEKVTYDDFCENLSIHVGSYFLITQKLIDFMKKHGGSIINIASIYGLFAPRFDIYKGTTITVPPEYAAAKGAIINFTRYLAALCSKHNIRVNSISPGGIENNQNSNFIQRYSDMVPLGKRMGNVDDLVGAAMFLLSDESTYITGQNLTIDGGWSLT